MGMNGMSGMNGANVDNSDRIPPQSSDVQALGRAFQEAAEMFKRASDNSESPAIQIYLRGMADAYELSAFRIREVLKPTVRTSPLSKNNAMLAAFRANLEMLESLGKSDDGEE